ncbi:hypothetical protein NDU88_006609 [Pleurodeles waltl]|uniref:CCHC-type domain-containing protein n=1 Tax=Pleurodeles waltl TaxID=8319 RepID=A0AAV7TXK2_PLEWA|nr:hypothetical protein NDU88_006609 [Pleurodeles waltl]
MLRRRRFSCQIQENRLLSGRNGKNIFENYARVCGTNLSGERKQALLLHCLGGEGQEVLENLPPLSQADQRGLNEYEICARQLDLHYLPKISTIMERYHFGLREQGKEESVEEYITALRKLASSCKFGALVEERIRVQFVLRCCSDKVREELWLKDEPRLDEVVSIAKRVEHMLKCVGELSKAHKEDKVSVKAQEVEFQVIQKDEKEKKYEGVREKGVVIENSAGKTQGNRRFAIPFQGNCYRCGRFGHMANATLVYLLNRLIAHLAQFTTRAAAKLRKYGVDGPVITTRSSIRSHRLIQHTWHYHRLPGQSCRRPSATGPGGRCQGTLIEERGRGSL